MKRRIGRWIPERGAMSKGDVIISLLLLNGAILLIICLFVTQLLAEIGKSPIWLILND